MWRGSQTLHGGTVEVAVLPPVATTAWTVKGIERHVADVREMFVATLADFPDGYTRRQAAAANGKPRAAARTTRKSAGRQ